MLKTKKTHETLIRIPLENFHNIQDTVNATKKTKPKYSNNAWINEAIMEKLKDKPTIGNDYINWQKLFNEEVSLEHVLESKHKNSNLYKLAEELIMELKHDKVELQEDECQLIDNGFILIFTEYGGATEGDSVGWSREYVVECDYDYLVTDITYEQG